MRLAVRRAPAIALIPDVIIVTHHRRAAFDDHGLALALLLTPVVASAAVSWLALVDGVALLEVQRVYEGLDGEAETILSRRHPWHDIAQVAAGVGSSVRSPGQVAIVALRRPGIVVTQAARALQCVD